MRWHSVHWTVREDFLPHGFDSQAATPFAVRPSTRPRSLPLSECACGPFFQSRLEWAGKNADCCSGVSVRFP